MKILLHPLSNQGTASGQRATSPCLQAQLSQALQTTREIWEGDTKIGSLLEGRNSTNEDEDSDLINKEEVLFRGLSVYSDRLNKYHDVDWDVDDDQVSGFTCLLGGISMLANSILADGDACERWMDELNCKSEP